MIFPMFYHEYGYMQVTPFSILVLVILLFLMFLNDLSYVLSWIGIHAGDTTLYSSLGNSVILRRWNHPGNLNLDCSIVE